ADVVAQCVGEPEAVTRGLIAMANAAGGKDNVTVVYVEGGKFAATYSQFGAFSRGAARADRDTFQSRSRQHIEPVIKTTSEWTRLGRGMVFAMFLLAGGFGLWRLWLSTQPAPTSPGTRVADVLVVKPTESIAAALERAAPGFQ